MNKEEAIKLSEKYVMKMPFNWDIIPVADKYPVELKDYWAFKNYHEPRGSFKGDRLNIDNFFPALKACETSRLIKLNDKRELIGVLARK